MISCLGCHNKSITACLASTIETDLLRVLEAGKSRIKVGQHSVFCEGFLPGVEMATFSLGTHMALFSVCVFGGWGSRNETKLPDSSSYKYTNLIRSELHPMTSFSFNYFLKVLFPNIVTLWLRLKHVNFEGAPFSVQHSGNTFLLHYPSMFSHLITEKAEEPEIKLPTSTGS